MTLFALILSLGLVVDDPITNVDSIQRNIMMGKTDPHRATLTGVSEVLPPVIMSTLAIIVSFTPLFYISGMMGPYMAPMAANVPLTVTFSTVCALTIVPWMAYQLLKGKGSQGAGAWGGGREGRHSALGPENVQRPADAVFKIPDFTIRADDVHHRRPGRQHGSGRFEAGSPEDASL